jgi:predicted amidohydrolase
MTRFHVGFVQFHPVFGDRDANLRSLIETLRDLEADLLVLPELPFTGYYFGSRAEAMALAESPRRSAIVESLVEHCKARDVHIVTGFAERDGDRCFNASLLLWRRGVKRTYRKLHLFNEEKRWFDPGNLPLSVDRVGGCRVGMMVCYDWVVPEVARTLALRGAQVIAHPANLVLPLAQRAMITRCIENGVFSITANRTGADRCRQGAIRFTGRSQIVDPKGELLFRAPARGVLAHVEPIDPARTNDKSLTPRNHLLRDRRPEFYG